MKPKGVKVLNENGKRSSRWVWPVKILLITLALSCCISILSESVLGDTTVLVSILLLIPLLTLAIVSDVIGVAVASCSLSNYNEKYGTSAGGREGEWLIANAEKISSICNDVIGDVCGIISGAIGSNIANTILLKMNVYGAGSILMASIVSAIIAGITVYGKAISKTYAINYGDKITLFLGKILHLFKKRIIK